MKKITIFIFGIFLANVINAQYLTVGDPHVDWWYYNQGTIEDAEIIIHPQGLYLGIDMYLTFSGRGSVYTSTDTIELVCDFTLPEGSIVHDSWLWLNQDILKADLIDRWTATSIYNTIVGRRQDPSILYKTWDNNYELRIYPMLGDSTRRVRLAYLLPLTFTSNSVFASLPMNIINASANPIANVKIRIETDKTWKNPQISEYPELAFVDHENSEFKTNKLLSVNSANYYYSFTLQLDSPLKEGVFINQLDDNENYYQLAFLPSYFIHNIKPKNVLICVDYSKNQNSTLSADVFENLKHTIKNGLSPIDSFNLMFSSLNITPLKDAWVSVKDVDAVFNELSENPISEYSSLPTLLFKAVEFINGTKSGGEILLIANTEGDGEPEAANNIIADLMKEMGENVIPIHCADFLPYSNMYYFVGNSYYLGNDYLYINISRQTNGNYSKITWDQKFSQFLFTFSQTLGGLISSFDLHTSLNNGFCYSRFDLKTDAGFVYINKPFLQIGKYYGELPFNIEVAGLYNGEAFSESITINADDITETDTLLEEIWAGNYIELLESQRNSYSNEIVREIIDYSMSERVLSIYTAFLAIEPGVVDSLDIDVTIVDDDGEVPIGIENQEAVAKETVAIKSYPNPFNYETHFEVSISDNFKETMLVVTIYDISGKIVYADNIQNVSDRASVNYTWNGNDNSGRIVPKGTYIVVFSSSTFNEVVKVLKM